MLFYYDSVFMLGEIADTKAKNFSHAENII